MKNINEILKDYRNEMGVSLDELSKRTGIPKSTLSRYENNVHQKLDIKVFYEIAKVLKIPRDVLEQFFIEEPYLQSNSVPKVPLAGRVCAGNGIIAQEDIVGYETVESKYGTEDYFCLTVNGNSMSPKIDNGDIVLVKKQNYVDSGELAIVIVDDEDGMIKKVEYGDDSIKLVSFNLYYPERVFEKSDVDRVKIIGKVIESKRKWYNYNLQLVFGVI